MNDGVPFLGIVVLSVVGLIWLAGYLYGLYWIATKLGRRFRSRSRLLLPYILILMGAAAMASCAVFVPADPFTRFIVGLVVFVGHAHPFLVGFWVAEEAARREDHRVWTKRTDAWLSDWEHTPKD